MKTENIVIILVLVAGLGFILLRNKQSGSISQSVTEQNYIRKSISVNGQSFDYAIIKSDPKDLKLIANFGKKLESDAIASDYHCQSGINGSFYDESGQPLGWWEAGGVVRKKYTHNNLLNGYVGVDKKNVLKVSSDLPTGDWNWAMQSGPVLIEDGNLKQLVMDSDKPARRSVMAKDDKGRAILLSVYDDASRLDGPTLEILPQVVWAISKNEGVSLTSAINLDGGSASAFYSQEVKLPEIMAVGSFVCVSLEN